MKGINDVTGALLVLDNIDAAQFKTCRRLADAGYTLIFTEDDQYASARKQGLPSLPWYAHDGDDLNSRLEAEAARLRARVQQAERESTTGDPLPVPDEFIEAVRRQMLAIERLHAFHERCCLRAILVERGEGATHQAVLEAGRSLGIPIVRLASPIGLGEVPRFSGKQAVGGCETYCVAGKLGFAALREMGVDAERIKTTGVPAWDDLQTPVNAQSQHEARRRLCLDPQRPVVLFCGAHPGRSPYSFEHVVRWSRRAYLATVGACRSISPDLQLIVLPDPLEHASGSITAEQMSQADDLFREWSARQGFLVSLVARGDKRNALASCDIAVAPSESVVASELTLLERPVILLPITDSRSMDPEDETTLGGVALDLRRAIERAITDDTYRSGLIENARSLAKNLSRPLDGKADERTFEAIVEIVEKSRDQRVRAALSLAGQSGLRILLAEDPSENRNAIPLSDRLSDLADEFERSGHRVAFLEIKTTNAHSLPRMEYATTRSGARAKFVVTMSESSRDAEVVRVVKEATKSFLREHRFDVVHLHSWSGVRLEFLEAVKETGAALCYSPRDFRAFCNQGDLWHPLGSICLGPETVDKCVQCLQRRRGLVEDDLPSAFYRLADRRIQARRSLVTFDHVFCPSELHAAKFSEWGLASIGQSVMLLGSSLDFVQPLPGGGSARLIARCFNPIGTGHGIDMLVRAFRQARTMSAELRLHGAIEEPWYFDQLFAGWEAGDSIRHEPIRDELHLKGLLAETDLIVDCHLGATMSETTRRLAGAGVPFLLPDTGDRLAFRGDVSPATYYRPGDADALAEALRDWVAQTSSGMRSARIPTAVPTSADEACGYERRYVELLEESGRFFFSVNIVLVAPPGFPEAQLHREIVEEMAMGLRLQGIGCLIQQNKVSRDAVNVFVGLERIESFKALEGIRKIALCVDPLPGGSDAVRRLTPADEVWTFSLTDARRLEREGVIARVLPVAPYVRVSASHPDPDLDVVFEGIPTDRQQRLLQTLESFCEVTRFHGADDAMRRKICRRAKIALLLAPEDGQDVDVAKGIYLLRHGVFTIGEKSIRDDLRCWVEAPAGELANHVYRYLSKPEARQQQLEALRQSLAKDRPQQTWSSWLRASVPGILASSAPKGGDPIRGPLSPHFLSTLSMSDARTPS